MSREESLKEMERSSKALLAAKKLFEESLFEDAISRSYYAILHAAKSALISNDISVDSHNAVKNLFGQHLVKPGLIDKKYSKILREEQDDRYLADYDVAFAPEPERVQKRINDAESFIEAIKQYLDRL